MNATNLPLFEIAVCVLAPLAGVTPSIVEMRSVSPVHVVTCVAQLRTNASARPVALGAVAPRFRDIETNATYNPPDPIDGAELGPSPGVIPSRLETRSVVGEQVVLGTPPHVSRTNTCGVTPSNVAVETRFVASDTKATKRESELITGLKLSPFPAVMPSALIETSCVPTPEVVVEVTGRQKTWRVVPLRGADVTRFDASEVNATSPPAESIVGSQLGPFAGPPFGSTLTSTLEGMHDAVMHELRTKMSAAPFVSLVTKLLEMEANAICCPFVSVEGPEVVTFGGVAPVHSAIVPQIPFSACDASGAKSKIIGSPTEAVGFTANTAIFEVPPPGDALKTCI